MAFTIRILLISICILFAGQTFPPHVFAEAEHFDTDVYVYDTGEIQFPFELIDNRIIVTVEHETLGTLKLLVDTGATTSVLFRQTTYMDTPLATTGFKRVHFPAFNIKSFGKKIRELPIKTQNWFYNLKDVAYLYMPSTIASNTETPFDGIIGRQLFEDYTVGINIDTRTLILTSKDIDISSQYETSIDIDLKTQTPFVNVNTLFPWEESRSKRKLMIDTGYPGTMVIWGSQHYKNATTSAEFLHYKKRNVGFKMRTTFHFAGDKFRKVPTYLEETSPYYSKKREGIIGTAILNNYNYAFDYARGKLYIRPSVDPVNHSDIIAYPPNDGLFVKKRFRKVPDLDKSAMKIIVTSY